MLEHVGVLGVEEEDETDAEFVQGLQRFWIRGVAVLREQGVVDESDDVASAPRDFLLAADEVGARVRKEFQAVQFVGEVFQEQRLRFGVRLLHVVDQELGKIAGHDPAGTARIRQVDGVALRLLEGSQDASVTLRNARTQRLAEALLLDKHMRRGNVAVDEAMGGVDVRLVLELYERFWTWNAECPQEREPEGLALPLLVALAFPEVRKFSRVSLLLNVGHNGVLEK